MNDSLIKKVIQLSTFRFIKSAKHNIDYEKNANHLYNAYLAFSNNIYDYDTQIKEFCKLDNVQHIDSDDPEIQNALSYLKLNLIKPKSMFVERYFDNLDVNELLSQISKRIKLIINSFMNNDNYKSTTFKKLKNLPVWIGLESEDLSGKLSAEKILISRYNQTIINSNQINLNDIKKIITLQNDSILFFPMIKDDYNIIRLYKHYVGISNIQQQLDNVTSFSCSMIRLLTTDDDKTYNWLENAFKIEMIQREIDNLELFNIDLIKLSEDEFKIKFPQLFGLYDNYESDLYEDTVIKFKNKIMVEKDDNDETNIENVKKFIMEAKTNQRIITKKMKRISNGPVLLRYSARNMFRCLVNNPIKKNESNEEITFDSVLKLIKDKNININEYLPAMTLYSKLIDYVLKNPKLLHQFWETNDVPDSDNLKFVVHDYVIGLINNYTIRATDYEQLVNIINSFELNPNDIIDCVTNIFIEFGEQIFDNVLLVRFFNFFLHAFKINFEACDNINNCLNEFQNLFVEEIEDDDMTSDYDESDDIDDENDIEMLTEQNDNNNEFTITIESLKLNKIINIIQNYNRIFNNNNDHPFHLLDRLECDILNTISKHIIHFNENDRLNKTRKELSLIESNVTVARYVESETQKLQTNLLKLEDKLNSVIILANHLNLKDIYNKFMKYVEPISETNLPSSMTPGDKMIVVAAIKELYYRQDDFAKIFADENNQDKLEHVLESTFGDFSYRVYVNAGKIPDTDALEFKNLKEFSEYHRVFILYNFINSNLYLDETHYKLTEKFKNEKKTKTKTKKLIEEKLKELYEFLKTRIIKDDDLIKEYDEKKTDVASTEMKNLLLEINYIMTSDSRIYLSKRAMDIIQDNPNLEESNKIVLQNVKLQPDMVTSFVVKRSYSFDMLACIFNCLCKIQMSFIQKPRIHKIENERDLNNHIKTLCYIVMLIQNGIVTPYGPWFFIFLEEPQFPKKFLYIPVSNEKIDNMEPIPISSTDSIDIQSFDNFPISSKDKLSINVLPICDYFNTDPVEKHTSKSNKDTRFKNLTEQTINYGNRATMTFERIHTLIDKSTHDDLDLTYNLYPMIVDEVKKIIHNDYTESYIESMIEFILNNLYNPLSVYHSKFFKSEYFEAKFNTQKENLYHMFVHMYKNDLSEDDKKKFKAPKIINTFNTYLNNVKLITRTIYPAINVRPPNKELLNHFDEIGVNLWSTTTDLFEHEILSEIADKLQIAKNTDTNVVIAAIKEKLIKHIESLQKRKTTQTDLMLTKDQVEYYSILIRHQNFKSDDIIQHYEAILKCQSDSCLQNIFKADDYICDILDDCMDSQAPPDPSQKARFDYLKSLGSNLPKVFDMTSVELSNNIKKFLVQQMNNNKDVIMSSEIGGLRSGVKTETINKNINSFLESKLINRVKKSDKSPEIKKIFTLAIQQQKVNLAKLNLLRGADFYTFLESSTMSKLREDLITRINREDNLSNETKQLYVDFINRQKLEKLHSFNLMKTDSLMRALFNQGNASKRQKI